MRGILRLKSLQTENAYLACRYSPKMLLSLSDWARVENERGCEKEAVLTDETMAAAIFMVCVVGSILVQRACEM